MRLAGLPVVSAASKSADSGTGLNRTIRADEYTPSTPVGRPRNEQGLPRSLIVIEYRKLPAPMGRICTDAANCAATHGLKLTGLDCGAGLGDVTGTEGSAGGRLTD